MSLRLKTLSLLAASAFLVAACGDDDDDGGGSGETVSASDYANDVCTAFGDWRDTIQSQRDDLQAGLEPGISPEEGRQALEDFLGEVVASTEDLVTAVDDAGVPDAENGEQVADALQSIADAAKTELEEAESAVADLPTDSPEAFGAAASEFGTNVQEALSNVGQGLEDIESEELEKAFDEEEACSA